MKEIPLTQGKVAVVDDEDYEWLSHWRWHAFRCRRTWYARRDISYGANRKQVLMHNQILGTPQRLEGDHVDGDGLNNQRGNLRVATAAQNRRNQPPQLRHGRRYKGITLDKRTGKWIAQITYAGKTHYIGTYSTDVEAAKAYNEAAIGTFADFAWLNPV